MQALTYRCPHCQTTTDVTPDRVDATVICPNPECGKPFVCETPLGRLVGSREVPLAAVAELQTGAPTAEAEQDVLVTHPAPFRSRPFAASLAFLAIAAGIAGVLRFYPREQHAWTYASAALAALALVWLIGRAVATRFTRLTVTSKRTLLRRGVLQKTTREVRHDDVHLLKVDQTLLDRMLGVGTVSVSSAAGQAEPEIIVRGVPSPEEVVAPIRSLQA